MFQLIDTTLSNLLSAELQPPVLPELPNICFMTPDADFPGSVTLPALNLFLFSLQENRDRRNTDPLLNRNSDGSISALKAPVRVDCHYLITAYAKVSEQQPMAPYDEHWIIGEAMRVLFRYPDIPEKYWATKSLGAQGLPLHTMSALPTTRDAGLDLWQALGQKPRACFHYKVTANLDLEVAPEEFGPVTSVLLTEPKTS